MNVITCLFLIVVCIYLIRNESIKNKQINELMNKLKKSWECEK